MSPSSYIKIRISCKKCDDYHTDDIQDKYFDISSFIFIIIQRNNQNETFIVELND
mgnify:CR=1 FL=1